MHCPKCHAPDTKVVDSRINPEGNAIRRRRKCEGCGERFTTYEKSESVIPMVVKNDGRRENFNRDKILRGLTKACQKRPISMDQLELLLDETEQSLIECGKPEVPANWVGEFVMRKLYELDPVSYVRFASFYWDYQDIDSFAKNLHKKPHAQKKQDTTRELQ